MKRLLLSPVFLLCAISAGTASAHDETRTLNQGLTGPDRVWPNSDIAVCYNHNHTPGASVAWSAAASLRSRVVAVLAQTWERSADLDLTGFNLCPSDISTWNGIYVNVHPAGTGASAGFHDTVRGRVSLGIDAGAYAIAHEFGHVLGFAHSQMRRDTPTWCIDGPGGTFEEWYVDIALTEWDAASLMNYCSNAAGRGGGLSPLDVRGVQARYGVSSEQALGLNEAGDLFGASLAIGDFTNDGRPDLVVGAPGEALGAENGAGAAFLYDNNQVGTLQHGKALTQSGLGINEAGDGFATTMVAANLDATGADELVVSAPFEKPGSVNSRAGAIFVFREEGGLLAPLAVRDLSSSGVRLMGRALAAGDVDGDGRDEVLAGVNGGGDAKLMIFGLSSNGQSVVVEGEIYVGATIGPVIVADLFGDGKAEVVVGLPDGPAARTLDVGRVDVFSRNGTAWARSSIYQETGASPEAGDRFGAALALGDFDGDGRQDLAVGAPGEAVGTTSEAGIVSVYRNDGSTFVLRGHYDQGDLGVGSVEMDDRFGSQLTSGDFDGDGFDDLVVASPGEVSVGSGASLRPGYAALVHGGPQMLAGRRVQWLSQRPIKRNMDKDGFGTSMAAVDLDSDGVDELIVSAPNAETRESNRAGRVFVFRTPRPAMNAWYGLDQRHLD